MIKRLLAIACLGVAASVVSLASTTCVDLTNSSTVLPSSCTWTTADGAVLTFSNFNLINNNGSGSVSTTSANWDLTFSDFGTNFRINLAPTAGPITANSPSNGSGGGYQFFWTYQVVVTSLGTGNAGQLNNIIAGLSSSNVVANGSVQFTKAYNNAASGNISLLNTGGTSSQVGNATTGLPTSGPINVIDFVNVNGGNNGVSTATLNSFYNQFGVTTVVPEPVSVSLVGLGLLGLGFARRARR